MLSTYWVTLRCKRPVNAEKSFSVHRAPVVLTIHFKRFTPLGRKLGHLVAYEERLSLESVMSKGQYGPKYSLYGVISHAGGGPNSGHYYAHVKAANGNWYEMNDESVDRIHQAPINMKNAYILFYIQLPGQVLAATIKSNGVMDAGILPRSNGVHNLALANGASKKRKAPVSDDEREDIGEKTPKSFIGPVLPSSIETDEKATKPTSNGYAPSSSVDPNAEALKKKIDALAQKTTQHSPQTKSAVQTPTPLVDYADEDDEDDEDTGETVKRAVSPTSSQKVSEEGDKLSREETHMEVDSSPNLPPSSSPPASSPVAASSFYGNAKKSSSSTVREKTKFFESYTQSSESRPATPIARPSNNGANPYSKSRVGNSIGDSFRNRNLQKNVYGSKQRKKRLIF